MQLDVMCFVCGAVIFKCFDQLVYLVVVAIGEPLNNPNLAISVVHLHMSDSVQRKCVNTAAFRLY